MKEANTQLHFKSILYTFFFLSTLLICFIQSGCFVLTALWRMILELGMNLAFLARKLRVNLIIFFGIYLTQDLIIWLLVLKKATWNIHLIIRICFPHGPKNESYSFFTLPSLQVALSIRIECEWLWSYAVHSTVLLPSQPPCSVCIFLIRKSCLALTMLLSTGL